MPLSNPSRLLAEFLANGPVTVEITGDCMQTVIPRGSSVRIERCRWYHPGDIVTFRRGRTGLVTHRVLGYLPGRKGWRILTRADGAVDADAPVPLAQVLGRVTAIDQVDYRPEMRARSIAFLAWFGAAIDWLRRRCAG